MPYDIEGLILANEIKELTLECNDTKAQALGLPPNHAASEWATGTSTIATNTPCDDEFSPNEGFPRETAAVDTTQLRKGTSIGAEPASTLHQHAALIKQRRRTSAGSKTIYIFCHAVAKHRSD